MRCFFIPVCSKTQSLFRRPKNVKNVVRMEVDALTCRLAGDELVLLGLLTNDLKRSNYYMKKSESMIHY